MYVETLIVSHDHRIEDRFQIDIDESLFISDGWINPDELDDTVVLSEIACRDLIENAAEGPATFNFDFDN